MVRELTPPKKSLVWEPVTTLTHIFTRYAGVGARWCSAAAGEEGRVTDGLRADGWV